MRALGTRQIALAVVAAVIVVVAVVLLIGGGDDDVNNNAERYDGTEAEVATVVDDLGSAGRDGDFSAICDDILAPEFADFIGSEGGQDCSSELAENIPEGDYELEIETLDVQDDTATAGVADQGGNETVLHLERTEGDWLIVRFTPNI
jgi:hypothetical protein